MRCARKRVFCFIVAWTMGGLLAAGNAHAGDLVIVQDGQPRATIVVARDAAAPIKQKIQTAAEELPALPGENIGGETADCGRWEKPVGIAHSRGPKPAK